MDQGSFTLDPVYVVYLVEEYVLTTAAPAWPPSGVNTFTGGTTLAAGNLALGNAGALSSGPVSVNGGQLDLAGFSPAISTLNGSGGVITNSGVAATLTVSNNGNYAGSINDGAGQIALVKTGPGSLTLSGINGYGGGTTVSGGTLVATNANSLGTAGSPVSIGPATLEIASGFSSAGNISLTDPNATIQLDAPAVYTNTGTVSGTGD